MKRFVLAFFTGILFLILQTTVWSYLPFQWIRPDLLLIFILYLTFLFPPVVGGILAMFLGYLMDLFSGSALGFYTFTRPLLFFTAHLFNERFYLEGFSSQFLFAFLFGILEGVLILILMNALQAVSLRNAYPMLFTFLLPQSFFTGLVTPILFLLFQSVSSPFIQRPEPEIKERAHRL